MIKPVIQPETGGCGIASAATLAGLSYARAKRIAARLGIDVTDSRLWSDPAPLRRLLNELGVKAAASERPFTTWQALPDRALLAIKWHRERGVPHWHWVVFVRDGADAAVLDPKTALKNHVRRDFGRIRPKWFIAIQETGAER